MARYIDADIVLPKIQYRERTYGCSKKIYSKVIKDAPTADVRPERHSYYRTLIANTFMGRLDKDRNPIFQDRASYVCAECGRGTIVKDNFCSHCGAKMDGKDGESVG